MFFHYVDGLPASSGMSVAASAFEGIASEGRHGSTANRALR